MSALAAHLAVAAYLLREGRDSRAVDGGEGLQPVVELLASYSNSVRRAELQRCAHVRPTTATPTATPASKRLWSLQDRLDDRTWPR
jgi:hypothetical protein